MQDEISFGAWLRKQRRALDLTRQAFANQVGCAEVTLRRIEAGTLKPSRELASILLEKLGIPKADWPQWISFARGLADLPLRSAPSTNKPITNLPAPLTTFIGRQKEQSDVIKLITKHRLVTLTGPGGVGKTRLAIKVSEQVLQDYDDGVWLVEFAPVLDPLLVPRITAIAIGLRDEPQRPVIDMLSDYLREKHMLVVLDNCEHLLDACSQLADTLLKRCPKLGILATSREALGILGEAIYPVPSLSLPDIQGLVEKFRDYESVHLFEQRAQLARMDFSLTTDNAFSVAKICSQLDGIPLAIELAAARMSSFSAEQIAGRLQESLRLLTTGNRTALPRHQTLQAAIDWSFELLSLNEKTLFRRLSVFVKGWTLEAAQSICSGANLNSDVIMDLLTQLIYKSLVIAEEQPGKTRYRMLETIRQYASETLVQAGESDAVRDTHLEYFLNVAEQAEPYLIRSEQLEWLRVLDSDYENLRLALERALSRDTAEPSLRLCAALGPFWYLRSYWMEGSEWLRRALSKASKNPTAIENAARVRALYRDADLASALDNIDRMTASAELSFKLARVGSDRLDIAIAAFYLGVALMRRGEDHQAATILQESLNEFQELKSPYWEAQAYRWLGDILFGRGEITILEFASQNLSLSRIAGERRILADSLIGYAGAIFKQTDDAIKFAEEADSLIKQLGSSYNNSKFFLAELAWLQGKLEEAKQILVDLAERHRVLGEKFIRSDAIADLGLLAMEEGKFAEAQEYFEDALVTARELKSQWFVSWRYSELGKLFFLRGEIDKSKQKFKDSISSARDISPVQKIHPLVLTLSTIYSQKPENSTRIIGAIDAFLQKMGERIFDPRPLERYYDDAESHTRETLGEVAFESAFAHGQKMSLDESLDLALKTVEEM